MFLQWNIFVFNLYLKRYAKPNILKNAYMYIYNDKVLCIIHKIDFH